MDRDEVPVNCEQVQKGIWRQAKQDEGGLEAHVISPMLHLCLTSSCLSLQCLTRRAMTNCNGEGCTMHLGTLSGSKIMNTYGEMPCFKDLPLFAIIAMRSCGNQDARSALRPALSRMLVNCLVSCAYIHAHMCTCTTYLHSMRHTHTHA